MPSVSHRLPHGFVYGGGDGHGQVGPDGLSPWQRESVMFLGNGYQQELQRSSQQRLAALARLTERLAIVSQALEDMGEGASTDVDHGYLMPRRGQASYPLHYQQHHNVD